VLGSSLSAHNETGRSLTAETTASLVTVRAVTAAAELAVAVGDWWTTQTCKYVDVSRVDTTLTTGTGLARCICSSDYDVVQTDTVTWPRRKLWENVCFKTIVKKPSDKWTRSSAIADKPSDAALWWMTAIYWPDYPTFTCSSLIWRGIPSRYVVHRQ